MVALTSTFPSYSHVSSRIFLWMPPAARVLPVLVSQRLPRTAIPSRADRVTRVSPHHGSHQRFCAAIRGHTVSKRMFSPSQWSRLRCVAEAYCTRTRTLLSFHTNIGVCRGGSVQRSSGCCGYVRHNGRQTPASTTPSKLYGWVVDVGAALLGSRPSLAPGSLGGVGSFAWHVSFLSSPPIMYSLVSTILSCIASLPPGNS